MDKEINTAGKDEIYKTVNVYNPIGICETKYFDFEEKSKLIGANNSKINGTAKRDKNIPIIYTNTKRYTNDELINDENKMFVDYAYTTDLDNLRDFQYISNLEELESKIAENTVTILEQINRNPVENNDLINYYQQRYANYPEIAEQLNSMTQTY